MPKQAHTHTHTPSCVTYTFVVVYVKVKVFKPLPFPLKIVCGADFVSVFPLNILLHFETDNNIPKRLLFENISFVKTLCVSPHSVSSSYTVWTFFFSGPHFVCYTKTHTPTQSCKWCKSRTCIFSPIIVRMPHRICK